MKPYYQDNAVTIYHGDCREILPNLPVIDVIFADPPYGIGKAEWDVEYPTWLEDFILIHSRAVAITPGMWALPKCLAGLGGDYKGIIVGRNLNGMTYGPMGISNWIPIVCGGDVPRNGQDVFDFTVYPGEKPDHPSPKPFDFMRKTITRVAMAHWTICDVMMGSGTTLRAAKDLGRKAIGIEIEEKYCEIAARRMAQEVLDFKYERIGSNSLTI